MLPSFLSLLDLILCVQGHENKQDSEGMRYTPFQKAGKTGVMCLTMILKSDTILIKETTENRAGRNSRDHPNHYLKTAKLVFRQT